MMYTIAVLIACISLVLILGVLAFLVSLVAVLLRAGVKAMAAASGNLAIKAARFASRRITERNDHFWHAVTR